MRFLHNCTRTRRALNLHEKNAVARAVVAQRVSDVTTHSAIILCPGGGGGAFFAKIYAARCEIKGISLAAER